ncbi:MAG: hypothetical protein WBG86_05435 [Polyangiales bacterium]
MRTNLSRHFDLDEVRRLYKAELPTPVDVLNCIHFKDQEAYRWYGVLVIPTLRAVGGRVGWFGVHTTSFAGEPQAEELGVVRYPSQRRFFALVLNPYYIAVANPQRLKAVRKFHASFTHSPCALEPLRRSGWVLALHHRAGTQANRALETLLDPTGAKLAYHSEETSPIVIAKKSHPANTNPLVYPSTTLFAYPTQEQCEEAITPGLLNQLKEITGSDISLQLYRRQRRSEALPRPLLRFLRKASPSSPT